MLHEVRRAGWSSPMYMPEVDRTTDDRPSEFYIAALGWLYSDGSFAHEQISDSIAVHVIESGYGTFTVGDTVHRVTAGDIFTMFPGNHYRYEDSPETPWRYGWFRVAGTRAVETMRQVGLDEATPLVRGEFAAVVEPLLKEGAALYATGPTPPLYPQALAWRLADAIQRASVAAAPPRAVPLEEAALALMEEQMMSGITVDEIARKLGVTRSTLFRKFRDRYRVSPKEHLDTVRIERARRLLIQSNAPIRDIAGICGYEDGHYFSRAFKRQIGCTPSEARARR